MCRAALPWLLERTKPVNNGVGPSHGWSPRGVLRDHDWATKIVKRQVHVLTDLLQVSIRHGLFSGPDLGCPILLERCLNDRLCCHRGLNAVFIASVSWHG